MLFIFFIIIIVIVIEINKIILKKSNKLIINKIH